MFVLSLCSACSRPTAEIESIRMGIETTTEKRPIDMETFIDDDNNAFHKWESSHIRATNESRERERERQNEYHPEEIGFVHMVDAP